jgi:hypothetical protein
LVVAKRDNVVGQRVQPPAHGHNPLEIMTQQDYLAMTTDYRVLCAELVEAIEDDAFFHTNDALRFSKAVLSARTALAEHDAASLLNSLL